MPTSIVAIIIAFLFPLSVLAQSAELTRRDGYLMLWESIRRPAYDTRETYADMPDDARGALEINYGKQRGLLEDEEQFHPDAPLLLEDALLWLYRTRNVRNPGDMDRENLSTLIGAYPIIDMGRPLDEHLTIDALQTLMSDLDHMLRIEVHEVSNYGEKFHGKGTAFGEGFDMWAMTAAHRTYPHNTLVKVTNVDTEFSVIVRINDRGPFVEGRDMDLSVAAFQTIKPGGTGLLNATFERLGDVELVESCREDERVYQKRIARKVHFSRGIPHAFPAGEELTLQSNMPFVVQAITFPDGQTLRIQDFVLPDEIYRFTPAEGGKHVFHIGDTLGRMRLMEMDVTSCKLQEE